MKSETKEIQLNSLQSFKRHSGRTYEGERLQLLMRSIEKNGLINPINVRPIGEDQYEIICGHNRVKAMRTLGRSTIMADISELSDKEATEIFYESNLNQQSFSDWNYGQRIEAVKYIENMIHEYSQQGRRTDLERENAEKDGEGTSVQTRQKLGQISKSITTRDKMAHRLGISTATLSKYRRIIKLSDELLDPLVRLLDEKKITFEMAYIIANMRELEIRLFIEYRDEYIDRKVDLKRLKTLPHKDDQFVTKSRERVKEVFILEEDKAISVKRKKR